MAKEEFKIFAFDANGRYGDPEVTVNAMIAVSMASALMGDYHRVIITDISDNTVFEAIDGVVKFPAGLC